MLHGYAVEAQLPTTVLIDPKATYLLVNNDPANNASPINLASLGISPGDLLRLRPVGSYQYVSGSYYVNSMIAVFSSNSVLLAANILNRVPGAVAAGTPYVTPVTFRGSLPTDIPEDFLILNFNIPDETNLVSTTNISIHVPPGAAYLFVSAKDTRFSDNFDNPANNYGVLIERGTEAVLTAAIASPNTMSISWNTDSNQLYQAQTSMLLSGGWTNLNTPILGTGFPVTITNSIIGQAAAFYRVVRVP
jgi:hypothetical protein